MNKWWIILAGAAMLASFRLMQFDLPHVPDHWPAPHYDFSKNPVTENGFELGRQLFYDPNLSRDKTISCATCHLQYTGFAHVDHSLSHGIEGRKGTRNAPALINLAWNSSFHWDGGVNHLDVQPINPIQHPAEMDNSLDSVLHYLRRSTDYRSRFFHAFGDSMATSKTMLKALAQFTASLISANSRYDQYLNGEINFTAQEKNGLQLFQRFCSSCHTEPLFNSNQLAGNGLPIDPTLNDVGRYDITHQPEDSLKFRVPTLRNIAHTFPYMHDGRFDKLRQVIDHYTDGIDTTAPHLSDALRTKIVLTEHEKKDLIAFLHTLTDREFLYNPHFGFPR